MSLREVILPAFPRTRRNWIFDAAVALLLLGLSLSILATIAERHREHHLGLGIALLAAHSLCLIWRRSMPLGVLAVNIATGLAFRALGFPVVVLGVASLVALYTVASWSDRQLSLVALAVSSVAMAAALNMGTDNSDVSTLLGNIVVLTVVWYLGDSQRARRVYVTELEQRTVELEHAREELARSAVAEERLRIARELHDIVAHSMGMIAVQAGVGAHVIEANPQEAKRSLQAIEQASKSALGEIRRMLGLLRSSDEEKKTAPSPGLADLPRLAAEVRRTGLDIDLRVDDPPRTLPTGLELSIFRIVQEAITNVLKHAAANRARISVLFDSGVARVEIVDDGFASSAGLEEGHGIAGMRERVAMHGGTLDVERLRERGFRVVAVVPIKDDTA